MTSPTLIDLVMVERILEVATAASAVDELCRKHKLKVRGGIYCLPVVIRLMIYQRLSRKGTLSAAVQWAARHSRDWQSEPQLSKRVREGRISTATGGYSQARLKLPQVIASEVCDHIFEQLQVQMREQVPEVPRPVYVIDGTTLRLPHEKGLVQAFPPGHNQHGENHWPTMLLVAFHNAHTGLAMRPSWGPMYGRWPVSEQQLAGAALQRLPADAIVLADADFGIFAFAHAVHQTGRGMLFRLTTARAGRLLGEDGLRPGRRRQVEWEPSGWERAAHPDLAPGARVHGWVVVCRHPEKKDELLYFFTTLDLKPKRILALYKLRWNIETDLRSLKRTLEMHQLSSKTRQMVEKEVLMGVCAYNVVRMVMYLAAAANGLPARRLSFSVAQDAVMAAWPYLQCARTPAEFQQEVQRLLVVVARAKLPERPGKRSYPRKTWGRGQRFPSHGSGNREVRP
jgi:hypothetical protein